MNRNWLLTALLAGTAFSFVSAQETRQAPDKVIIDSDLGDDIDDAFAIGLALHSPELKILGVITAFGDTGLRAKLADRLLGEAGRPDIPVAAGIPTQVKNPMSQQRYAEGGLFAKPTHAGGVEFLLEQIRRSPNEITLIAIGPLVNIGAAIDQDGATFRKLKRVVIMGGSIKRGYGDVGFGTPALPQPEWNILNEIPGAQKLFDSGVPLYVMPLDSTQLKLDEVKRAFLFRQGTPLTDALTLLYHQWGQQTPTMFDAMAVAYAVKPSLCPTKAMHIRVDEKGMTLAEPGKANAQVCLESSSDEFFQFFLARVAGP